LPPASKEKSFGKEAQKKRKSQPLQRKDAKKIPAKTKTLKGRTIIIFYM
jgi:hypothetical protein